MLRKTVAEHFAPPAGQLMRQQRPRPEPKCPFAKHTMKSTATHSVIVDCDAAFSFVRFL
jgi:hypothetical protein